MGIDGEQRHTVFGHKLLGHFAAISGPAAMNPGDRRSPLSLAAGESCTALCGTFWSVDLSGFHTHDAGLYYHPGYYCLELWNIAIL